MKTLFISFLASVLLTTQGGEGQIEPKEFRKVLQETQDVQLIDVRTLREYQSGYLEHAVHIDFYQGDFQQKVLELDKNKPVAIYCAVGGRSASTAQFLRQNGFTKVYDLKGGIFEWSRKGYKIIKE